MVDDDPYFAVSDPRAALFESLKHLRAKDPVREELLDAAVWVSDVYGVDYVFRVRRMGAVEALDLLVNAGHDGFMCECCGHHTFERPVTQSSYQICNVCGWEDSDPMAFGYDGSNEVDLGAAQQNFLTIGACEETWVALVSPGKPGQIRDNGFETFEARRQRLLKDLEKVFDSDEPNRGMTLEDARAADDYDVPSAAYEYERSQSWHEVTDARLDEVDEWVFLDKAGAFFYVPAIVRFVLSHYREPGSLDPLSAFFGHLRPRGSWIFDFTTKSQLIFLADALTLLADPWIYQRNPWSIWMDSRTRKSIDVIVGESRRLKLRAKI